MVGDLEQQLCFPKTDAAFPEKFRGDFGAHGKPAEDAKKQSVNAGAGQSRENPENFVRFPENRKQDPGANQNP